MNIPSPLGIASVLLSATFIAGCAGGSATGANGAVTPSVMHQQNRTGSRVAFVAPSSSRSTIRAVSDAKVASNLYVSDEGNAAIDIYSNKKFVETGQITSGLDGNDGDWIDSTGNLYVANYASASIQEYAPGATSPTFTYSAGLEDPINVSTDNKGDVFASDFGGGTAGVVNEYAQGSNVVKAWCTVPGDVGGAEGVAVDGHGDVFMAYNGSGVGPGQIAEFVHGLKGCNATILPVTFHYIGGIALDKHNNLIVCEQGTDTITGTVYQIAPPYNALNKTIGVGWRSPFHISLRKNNKVLIVADPGSDLVTVRTYPKGAVTTSLGKANGILQAVGVADVPEAI
jgi:hypothetical protein